MFALLDRGHRRHGMDMIGRRDHDRVDVISLVQHLPKIHVGRAAAACVALVVVVVVHQFTPRFTSSHTAPEVGTLFKDIAHRHDPHVTVL